MLCAAGSGGSKADYFYVETDKVKPILVAGLNSVDLVTREAAMDAQDDLLRACRFEYLALD